MAAGTYQDLLRRSLAADDMNADNEGYTVPEQGSPLENGQLVAKSTYGIPAALKEQMRPAIQRRILQVSPPAPRPPAAAPVAGSPAPAPAAPAEPAGDDGGLGSPLLRSLIAKQLEGVGDADRAVDEYKNRPQQTNISPILSLLDSWYGGKLASGYKAPESDDERAANVATLRDKALQRRQQVTSDMLNLEKSKSGLDQKFLIEAMRGLNSGGAAGDKELDRQGREARMTFDPSRASTRNAVGKLFDRKEAIHRLFALGIARPNFDFDKREMEDFGTSLAAVIGSGSSVVADSKVQRLLPESYRGRANGLLEWLTNDPRGLGQQAFVRRMFGDVIAEDDNVNDRFKSYEDSKSKAFNRFKRERPDEFDDYVQMWRGQTQTPEKYVQLKQRLRDMDKADADKAAAKKKPGGTAAPAAAAAAAAPPVDDGKVVVEHQGRMLRIPKSQLQNALKDGAKEVKQ